MLAETRPTAINLRWALGRMRDALLNQPRDNRAALAWKEAAAIADEDVAMSEAIGENGLAIIRDIAAKKPGKTQHSHPLQCRLAGDGGLRHRPGADLSGA